MTSIGDAFIEVHADTKAFDREIATKLKAAVAGASEKVEPQARKLGEKMSQQIGDGVDKNSPWIRRAFRRIGTLISGEGNSWSAMLKRPFERMAKGNFILTRMFGQTAIAIGGATVRIAKFASASTKLAVSVAVLGAEVLELSLVGIKMLAGFGGDATKSVSAVANAFVQVGVSFAALIPQLAAMAINFVAVAAAIFLMEVALAALVAILTVALAPFATLIGFLVLIPSLVAGAVFTIAPLVVALHGVGDALQVLAEKDPKKFAEKLKALPPVMRELVMAVKPVLPLLRSLRDSVQAAFLGPILTQLGPFLKAVLPTLSVGFTAIAQALGNIVLNIMRVVSSREALDGMASIMGQIAQFLDTNAGTIGQLIAAFGRAAEAMLPSLLQLFTTFSGFMSDFATWIEGAVTDGRFQHWLDVAIESAQSIWDLIKSLIGLLKEMFSQTDEGGRKFLDKVTAAINKFTEWLKSPQGQKALQNAVGLANAFADAFGIALDSIRTSLTIINKIVDAVKWIKNNPIGKIFTSGVQDMVPGFSGGGVVPRDEMAMVHRGEPILDPANSVARNRAILADAGMLDVLSQRGNTVVNVYLGTERLEARMDYRIAKSNQQMARTLSTGPRRT